ncbi:MAG: hypothetical protein IT487_01355 [Chromatiaceae bacterium]|nr:hypothetical protein [Chromatiaceae bacterium]
MLQNSNIREPTLFDRLKTLMHRLTDHTVLSDLLDPVSRVLARVRQAAVGRTLTMPDFIALGVLRHLQGMSTLREQVQTLWHLAPEAAARGPLARSTWSDALAAPRRQAVLAAVVPALVQEAQAVLPDRLAGLPGLGDRPVRAIDGTYQVESAYSTPIRPLIPR